MLDFKEKMKIKKYRNSLFFVILALLIIGSSAGLSYLSMQDDHLLQRLTGCPRGRRQFELQCYLSYENVGREGHCILCLWTIRAKATGDLFHAGDRL